ncbi:helix-turn-helix domain-containing protein [Mumia sp. zg.B53]|uniref:ArsR/SmtB family transcription factor n=1 Tax=unclassified Mumia TaxID=2621872 RepID=UPI001C6DEE44|nr:MULTISPECIES: helix-turn-helix domain-containing protein [unclassified Mumia]MBW9205098.1 helix-turn-helix domain-containing protein [Mumia sp. zg.B17]MBW9208898.1 helix-turn-helix domain-containing protein [Mumia sp. zg.B21]MBW9213510.1 helix-turn-helix domain-containing protein [Mumia sp. zg.B53]
MAAEPTHVVLDSSALKALAHPLRVSLLGALRRYGPATATQLGQRLSISSGSASYHLRQLERAGLVADDTTRGNARDRWWRAAHRSTTLRIHDLDPTDDDAVDTYLRSVAANYTLLLQQAVNERATLPSAWRGTLEMSDYLLRLTPDEAKTLAVRLHTVVREFRYDVPENRAPEDADRVSVILQVLPQPETASEDGRDGDGLG